MNKLMSMFSGGRLRMERPSNSSSTSEGFAPCTPPSLEDFSQGKARERDRIATVHALGALNTPGEERFDSITKWVVSFGHYF